MRLAPDHLQIRNMMALAKVGSGSDEAMLQTLCKFMGIFPKTN